MHFKRKYKKEVMTIRVYGEEEWRRKGFRDGAKEIEGIGFLLLIVDAFWVSVVLLLGFVSVSYASYYYGCFLIVLGIWDPCSVAYSANLCILVE